VGTHKKGWGPGSSQAAAAAVDMVCGATGTRSICSTANALAAQQRRRRGQQQQQAAVVQPAAHRQLLTAVAVAAASHRVVVAAAAAGVAGMVWQVWVSWVQQHQGRVTDQELVAALKQQLAAMELMGRGSSGADGGADGSSPDSSSSGLLESSAQPREMGDLAQYSDSSSSSSNDGAASGGAAGSMDGSGLLSSPADAVVLPDHLAGWSELAGAGRP
jgi:hypothetical protein